MELPRHRIFHYVCLSDLYSAFHNDYIQIILSMANTKPDGQYPKNSLKEDFFMERYKQDQRLNVNLTGFPFYFQKKRLDCALHSHSELVFKPIFKNIYSKTKGRFDALYHKDVLTIPPKNKDYYMVIMETTKKPDPIAKIKASFLRNYAFRGHDDIHNEDIVIHNLVNNTMRYFTPDESDIDNIKQLVFKIRKAKEHSFGFLKFGFLPKYAYPNMKHNSIIWEGEKKEIAKKVGEITQIWGCTIPYRMKAFQHNIYSIYDKNLNADILGFENHKRNIVDAIINVNRDVTKEFVVHNVKPLAELSNLENLVFVDFEWIDRVYLVGVFDGKNYKSFWAQSLKNEDVDRMWSEVIKYIEKKTIVYWYAEKSRFIADCPFPVDCRWLDLCGTFRDSTAVRGATDFKLKNIGKAFHNLGYMPYFIDSFECQNGLQSIEMAVSYFNGNHEKKEPIEKYNKFDCESMYYIAEKLKTLS